MFFARETSEAIEFYRIIEVMLRIRSFDDLVIWFNWLDAPYKIVFCIVALGITYLLLLFFMAMFSDKHI